jgi:hypothetical protein
MTRNWLAALCLLGAVAVPAGGAVAPAQACGYVRVPVDTEAEIAAIRKALASAKLTDPDRARVMQMLATAEKGKAARTSAEFGRALAESLKLLGIERIFRKHSCMTIRIPVVTS